MTNFNKLQIITANFVDELSDSLKKKNSLPFIRHSLATKPIVSDNHKFQVIVIGGSFYQKAIMIREKDNIRIVSNEQGKQPPFLTESGLLEFIKLHLEPDIDILALNFAYPLIPVTRDDLLDGALQSGSKENTFVGLIGKKVGETIEKYIHEKQGRVIKVSAANDTICLLLSGLALQIGELVSLPWDHLAAGVVGTGLNFAIFLDRYTAVNLESANFNKFPQTEAGRIIDQSSVSPGSALYEKEVSGAYIYEHFNYVAKHLQLNVNGIKNTKELDELVTNKDPEVAKVAKDVLEHSASLVAAQIAGLLRFCKRDLTFIMQGSLFWKGYKFKEIVEKIVNELCPEYKATFQKDPHSDLYGAAKLVA